MSVKALPRVPSVLWRLIVANTGCEIAVIPFVDNEVQKGSFCEPCQRINTLILKGRIARKT